MHTSSLQAILIHFVLLVLLHVRTLHQSQVRLDQLASKGARSVVLFGIVIGVKFVLAQGDGEAIHAKMAELTHLRESKQPLEYPSCGSVFKRPTGYFTGKLIQEAGLQGYRIGGAEVSKKHAGFIVNIDK